MNESLAIFGGAPVLAANVIGQIWLLNPAARWLTGWSEEEMLGRHRCRRRVRRPVGDQAVWLVQIVECDREHDR